MALCCPLVVGADSAPSEAGGPLPGCSPLTPGIQRPAPTLSKQKRWQLVQANTGRRNNTGSRGNVSFPGGLRSWSGPSFPAPGWGRGVGVGVAFRTAAEVRGEIKSTVLCADPGRKGSESSLPVIKETASGSDQPTPLSNRQADQSPLCSALFSKD